MDGNVVCGYGGLVRGNKFMHNCLQNVCVVFPHRNNGHNWTFEYNEFGETSVLIAMTVKISILKQQTNRYPADITCFMRLQGRHNDL